MNPDHARTIAILKEMANGKIIKIGDYEIGMADDMSIGAIMTKSNGQQHIGGLSTMDLAQFNTLLNKYDIGMPIPC